MKKYSFIILAMLALSIVSSSCGKKKTKEQKLESKWKQLADKDGNYYETGKLIIDPSAPPTPTGVTFTKEIMLEDLTTGAKSDGTPTNDASGFLSVGCYKDIRSNCDTLGALYSAEKSIGQTIAQLAGNTATSGDADGDGFDDASVRAALIAAGYNPDYYTISTLYDTKAIPSHTGVTVNDTLSPEGKQTPDGLVLGSINKNLTYGLLQKSDGTIDTIYTDGVGLDPQGNPKKVVPDLSKINFTTITIPTTKIQGSCPTGWHIPSDGEWKQVEMALGMSATDVNKEGIDNDRGGKDNLGPKLAAQLKLKYSGYWSDSAKAYAQLGIVEAMWTSTGGKDRFGNDYVWIRYIDTLAHKGIIRKKHYIKSSGFSIRCFKD